MGGEKTFVPLHPGNSFRMSEQPQEQKCFKCKEEKPTVERVTLPGRFHPVLACPVCADHEVRSHAAAAAIAKAKGRKSYDGLCNA